ncbi:Gfo/Idh/MocA family protein [Geosporobacter ferrireducens]|uniref:Dehydrogenase n=1 Tax=Geosporobacter ferrireducens TaxID=1424294 RepID=A0A1D8GNR3_9FIRM|nr:Gfo/Idh/MocA family oxidoreductase [Geosporobacter ferrireducens]AOT72570.1 dehydrogenase [Geosporobacter ferrireducens]
MRKFKAGVIGIGFIGVAHVEALRRIGNIEVVAIVNPNDAAEKAKMLCVPKWFDDYREMLDTVDLDVVHICTPNHTHYEIAMYVLQKGIHVVCEKPFTTTVKEAQELVAIAKEKGLINAVNFHNRFNPMIYQLKKMIQNEELGEVFSIHGGYVQDWLLYDTDYNWRINSEESGKTRAVADIGSHWMDTVENVTGLKIVEVFAEFTTYHKTRKKLLRPIETFKRSQAASADYEEVPIDTEDIAFLLFRFNNGAKGNATISQMCAGRKNKISLFISGSKQSAEWDSENLNELFLGRRDGYNQIIVKDPSIVHEGTKTIISYPGGHVEGFPDTFKQCFAQIYQSIEGNRSLRDFAIFEDGLRGMILCEKIMESVQIGQWVKVE